MSWRKIFGLCWRTKDAWVLSLMIQACCLQNVRCGLQALSIIAKPASQSMGYYPASKAVDGVMSTFSHGADAGDPHPWWRVDLVTEHCLGEITVTTRQYCCGEYRFTGAVARAGLGPNYTENQPCGSPATRTQSTNGATHVFLCDAPRMARYVTLDIDKTNPDVTDAVLMLAEVTVKEYTAGECPSLDGPTTTVAPTTKQTSAEFPKTRNSGLQMLYKGGLIGNSVPLSTKKAKSLLRCAGYCSKDAHCFSFDFAPVSGQCRLHNLNSTDIEMSPNEDFSVYVRNI
ncbi:uncharacterized protein LOC119744995 isoform X1 [Patiria miniata]|uniref:Apple domain-containing protein n=1 Tax=Patiria miniata TaxID=46514 RepID=A0A914BN43_PATMI|nr:uncharacterized protein LOC119744995 isoform X1 [Patiria miniata]